MGDTKLSTSDIIILAAGAVMLIASFLAFYEFGPVSESAWGSGIWPLGWFPMLFGVAMAAHIALTKFANVNLPEKVLDFTWDQIHVVLSIGAVGLMIGFLIREDGGFDKGIGYWLLFLGSIALVIGAVLRVQESPTAVGPGTTPPTPF